MAQQVEFSWAAAADVGLGLLGGLAGAYNAGSRDIVNKANADAQNTVRRANEQVTASAISLAGTVRSINNARIMRNMQKSFDTITTNALRTSESFTKGNFEQTIKDAEKLGAGYAAAAASGLGGSGIEAIASTQRLMQARAEQSRDEQQGQVTYDQARQLTGLTEAAIGSMDTSPITGRWDRNVSIANSTDTSGMILAGLLAKKDSLHTMLGSIGFGEKVTSGAVTHPVSRSSVEGTALAPFSFADGTQDLLGAQAHPVSDNQVQGRDLGPMNDMFEGRNIGPMSPVTLN